MCVVMWRCSHVCVCVCVCDHVCVCVWQSEGAKLEGNVEQQASKTRLLNWVAKGSQAMVRSLWRLLCVCVCVCVGLMDCGLRVRECVCEHVCVPPCP